MAPPTSEGVRRRTVVRMAGLAAGGTAFRTAHATPESGDGPSISLDQDGECVQLTPLAGSEPVADLYRYRYPTEQYDGPPGSAGSTFSSHGTTALQRDNTSILFLYDGPEGLSLVVVHGRLEGEEDAGGTVTFDVAGLPSDGQWLVRDDYYLTPAGNPAPSNFDRWALDGETHTIDWAYQSGRTDGGVFRGLRPAFDLRIEPAFNEAAALAAAHDFGPIESWEVLSGDRDDPERHSLGLDRPVTIRTGDCPAGDDGAGADSDVTAAITDLSVAGGTFDSGDVVPAHVTVTNTGGQSHTFSVGYSVSDPSGEEYHNDGTTDEPVTLDAGETRTVTVEWTVEDDAPPGIYDAQVIIWRDRHDGALETPLDRREIDSAFMVA